MKFIKTILLLLVLLSNNAFTGGFNISYNVDIDYESLNGQKILHNDVMRETFSGLTQNHTPTNISNLRKEHIIGYHKDSNGLNYFLFDTDFFLNGAVVVGNDIIKCDNNPCTSHSYYLVGNDPTIKHLHINAFSLDPVNGDLIFSIDSAELINGEYYFPADLIRLHRATGTYSLELDSLLTSFGSDVIGPNRNIDAVSYLSNGYYIVSFASDGEFNGFSYNKSDIVALDTINAIIEIYVSPNQFSTHKYKVNVTSLMGSTPALSDIIFSDGFE